LRTRHPNLCLRTMTNDSYVMAWWTANCEGGGHNAKAVRFSSTNLIPKIVWPFVLPFL
jgi:hypothetical protein